MTRDEEQHDELPEGLIDALKAADKPMPIITARVDNTMGLEARRTFAARMPRFRRPVPTWSKVAAAVLVGVFLVRVTTMDSPVPDSMYADHDGSGRVDIADVLHVARTSGSADPAELDAFALRVVSLSANGGAE